MPAHATTLSFTCPLIDGGAPLIIDTGLNEINWSYGLNYKVFDTLGGQVIQILSTYIDDVTVMGEVQSYAIMEKIYQYFASYILSASTAGTSSGPFKGDPITMTYAPRNWTMDIRPTSMPGLKYGRDVIVPQWRMTAAVVDVNHEVGDTTAGAATKNHEHIDLDTFGTGSFVAAIGYLAGNPFQVPETDITQADLTTQLGKLADGFNQIVQGYANGQYGALGANYSKPAFLTGGVGSVDSPGVNSTSNNVNTTAKPTPTKKKH